MTQSRQNKRPAGKPTDTFANRLRAAIRESDEAPFAIARAAGISHPQLYRFLRNNRSLTIEPAERLARYLGFDLVQVQDRQSRQREE